MQLGEICDLIVDCEHKTAPTQESGYPSIRTPNIGRGYFILDKVNRVSEETYRLWTRRAVPKQGDLIMAREAPVGNVAIIPPGLKPCLGQRTLLIRCNKAKAEPSYVSYLLNGPQVQATIFGMTSGATVPHLNMKDVRTLPIPGLPPLPTQRKIASILSAYDDLIENNLRRIKILEEMAQSLYREWFVKFRFPRHENVRMVDSPLGKIPEGWQVARLIDVCHLVMGQSPKSEFYNTVGSGLPFHQGVTDFGERYPTDRMYCTVENRIAEKGDVLFSVRAPVGRINVSNKRIVIGRGLSAIRHRGGCQWFAFHQLKERFKEKDTMGGGTIFKSVTKKDMEEIDFSVPNDGIVARFEEIVLPLEGEIENLTKRNSNLRRTRDLLLPRLISGELDVSNLFIKVPQETML